MQNPTSTRLPWETNEDYWGQFASATYMFFKVNVREWAQDVVKWAIIEDGEPIVSGASNSFEKGMLDSELALTALTTDEQ